jgi:hypothetical protein
VAVAIAAVVAFALTACGAPAVTFDPAGPCVVDGQVPGAYPDLEARVPRVLDGASATSIDSGRNCTAAGLGSLASHGLASVTFAGATWDLGSGSGVTSVVFAAPESGLEASWIAEFYETGARSAKKVSNVETSRPTFEGAGGTWRLDALSDLSLQTIVSWQDAKVVRAVLVASAVAPDASRRDHDELVGRAVQATVDSASAGT